MNKDKRNNIQLLGTLNNTDESGIIANANQIYDANEDKSTQDVSKEHTERIETLETKESSMQTTLENITKTGEASAASNVTYNHNDSKIDATNVQQAIDEVRKRSNYNDGDNIIDFNTIHLIQDNPKYIWVFEDAEERILVGQQIDGNIVYGGDIPKQVKDYIDNQINKILGVDNVTETIDSLKEIEFFLKDFTNSDTLKQLLDSKANVVDLKTITDDIYKKSNPNDEEGNIIDTNELIKVSYAKEDVLNIVSAFKRVIKSFTENVEITHLPLLLQDSILIKSQDNNKYHLLLLDKDKRIICSIPADTSKQDDKISTCLKWVNNLNESVNKNSTLIEEIAHVNHLEFTPDDTFHAYINGLYFAQDLQSTICDLAKDGDKMVHVSTFTIINDIIYATYYCNTIDGYEAPSKHTARFVIAPLSTISDKTTYQYIDLCYTQTVALNDNKEEILIDNKHITALYDIVLLRKDDNILFLEWTVALNGVFYRVYKTYNIETNEYSDIRVNTFTVNGETLPFNTINLKGLLDKNNIAYRPMFSDIGIMQKLSSREENGETYYYTGCYCGDFGAIIKSKDLINWIFVSSPSFMNESQWENAVYVKNNRVYYCCRQDQNIETNKIFLAYYDINRKTWSRPVYIFDAQSRYDMLEVDNKLYVVHSPRDRSHLAITQIDTNKIAYSKMIQVAQVPDCFYPFMQKYNGELYMSFTQSRKHIFISKFKIRYKSDSDINNKMLQFLNS